MFAPLDPVSLVLIVIALTVHEYAHAKVADSLGDPTPQSQGRVTLNPLSHLDPIGTLLITFIGFGWGKPVQIDPYNLKNPRKDELLIALAGPLSNIALALLSVFAIKFLGGQQILLKFFFLNLGLAVFNMIPIHPLDGSKVLTNALPFQTGHRLENFLQANSTILLAIFLLPLWGGRSLVSIITSPLIYFLSSLFL